MVGGTFRGSFLPYLGVLSDLQGSKDAKHHEPYPHPPASLNCSNSLRNSLQTIDLEKETRNLCNTYNRALGASARCALASLKQCNQEKFMPYTENLSSVNYILDYFVTRIVLPMGLTTSSAEVL